MSTLPKSYLTPEQYLELDRKAEFRSEYYDGEMFAMSGASLAHVRIVAKAMRDLGQQLRGARCEPFSNDLRVRVTPKLYAYPDIVIVCGEPQFADDTFDILINPSVIVEVLSKSTENYDRGLKARRYRTLQ